MSGKTLERSDLIDVYALLQFAFLTSDTVCHSRSYSQLHDFLSGRLEGTSPEQVKEYLAPRVDQLKLLKDPFGTPSEASRKRIQSGTVTLSDGVVFHLEDSDKDYILGISDAFKIDEVSAFVLLRSFMYNQGLPATDMDEFLVEACVEAITPVLSFGTYCHFPRSYTSLPRQRRPYRPGIRDFTHIPEQDNF